MKRLLGSLFCVLTVIVLFGGSLISSLSFTSGVKWSESISKLLLEEDCAENDGDSDSHLSFDNALKLKKNKFSPLISGVFDSWLRYESNEYESNGQGFILNNFFNNPHVPIWLLVRHILI